MIKTQTASKSPATHERNLGSNNSNNRPKSASRLLRADAASPPLRSTFDNGSGSSFASAPSQLSSSSSLLRGGGGASSRAVILAGAGPSARSLKNTTPFSSSRRKEEAARGPRRRQRRGWEWGCLNCLRGCAGLSDDVKLTRRDALDAVAALSLSQRQLRKLLSKFEEIDVDRSGSIEARELFDMLGEDRTPMTDRLFTLMDLDSSGCIEFDEFIAVLMTYCMYSRDDILRFCFDTFDQDHSNSIDEREFTALLGAINNGVPIFPGNFATALQNFDTNDDGLIDFNEFKNINQHFPLIFFPAFRLQDMMMKRTLGEQAWKVIHERVEAQRALDAYRREHGKDPPQPLGRRVYRALTCGMYERPEVNVELIDSKKPSIVSHREVESRRAALRGTSARILPSPRR